MEQAYKPIASQHEDGGARGPLPNDKTPANTPVAKARIILVGLTGHGKSRLGSFLVSPEGTLSGKDSAFLFCSEASAMTDQICFREVVVNGQKFEIVDSPGFAGRPAQDLDHTVQALKYLQSAGEISAIVLVFMDHWSTDGSTTREFGLFLRGLFGDRVLQTNLLLVVTNVSQGILAQQQRKANNMTVKNLTQDIQKMMQEDLHLEHSFDVVDIDTKPDSLKAENIALMRRDEIFRLVLKMPPVQVSAIVISKPLQLLNADIAAAIRLQHDVDIKQMQMEFHNAGNQASLDDIQRRRNEVSDFGGVIAKLKEQLADVGSDECEISAYEQKSWPNLLMPQPRELRAYSKTLVAHYVTDVQPPEVKFFVKKLSPYAYEMSVRGEPLGRLGRSEASITLYSKRKDINADSVNHLSLRLQDHEDRERALCAELVNLVKKSEIEALLAGLLMQEIADSHAKIAALRTDTMSVEAALTRLTEGKGTSVR